MDIDPDRFYSMDESDFWLKFEGWVEQMDHDESLLRHHAAVIISQCSMGKPVSIEKLWPVKRKAKKAKYSEKQLEILRKMREAEVIKNLNNESSTKGRG